ncbi:hypothetical protein BJ944DRAFT_237482 [Cunninghamella echinulata]|nr:hypothetical protein BJ944DRAFT_237482 [Cunninghamella echinulata]
MKYNIELRLACPNAFFIGYKKLPNISLLNYLQLINSDDGNTDLHLYLHSFDQQCLLSEMYELEEQTINAIHLSSPHIEVLKLIGFFMNHHHQYNLNNTAKILSCSSLKELYLDDCIITEPENFYFSSKFPHLSTLHINLNTHFKFKINDKPKFSDIICLDSININNKNNSGHENTTSISTNVTESTINSIMNVGTQLNDNSIIINMTGWKEVSAESSFTFGKCLKILSNLKELCLRLMDIDAITTTTTRKDDSDEGLYFFQLRHPTVYECDFYSSNNISAICEMCPLLLSLELNLATIHDMHQELSPPWPLINTFKAIQEYDDNFKVHIVVNCQLADIVLFDYE